QNEVNEIKAERIARTANPLALVAQQKLVYHPQNHPTHYTQNSSTRSQQAATKNKGKAIVNSPQPIYDEEPSMVAEYDEMSKDKEIDKLMALISLSFKKIYKPTNNNLRTSSNTSRANQDNSPRINRGAGYDNQRLCNVVGARETVETKKGKGCSLSQGKMLLCKQKEAGIQLNAEQDDWRDDTDNESEDQELKAHYMYMAQIQEVSPDAFDSGPLFDTELVQKVPNNDNYNVFFIKSEHPEQSKSVHDTYPIEQDKHNVIIDSLDMSYDREQIDQNDNDDDLANGQTNKLMYTDLNKFQEELDRRNDVEYASKVEIDCAKSKGDLISYKVKSQKSFNKYTQQINDLNQMISEMKKKLFAHQETISIPSQAKEAQIKLYKTCEVKELDKVIALENKVKESFNKQTTLLEKRMDESISWDQKCKRSKELLKIKRSVGTIFDGVERCKETIAKRTYFGHIDPFIQNTIEANFCPEFQKINADLENFHVCLKEKMVADLRYFNSLEREVDSLKSQLKTQKTQFLNEIDRISREYYYADHINAILSVYTELDE
nr:hypothetical protein [Tanacetum cinerariifolium]GFB06647.1 hypothetical protein [Tanacetum cinerariifolium]